MDCARAEELLSDHYEKTLDPVLRADMEAHLAGCARCRTALRELGLVVETLRALPREWEAPAGLADRAAAAAVASRRPRLLPAMPAVPAPAPRPLAVAAMVAIAVAGSAMWAGVVLASQGTASLRSRGRIAERLADTRVQIVERRDRVMEELSMLRVLVATVFEGRLDRAGDLMEEYRRLLEREQQRQQPRETPAQKSQNPDHGTSVKTNEAGSTSNNEEPHS